MKNLISFMRPVFALTVAAVVGGWLPGTAAAQGNACGSDLGVIYAAQTHIGSVLTSCMSSSASVGPHPRSLFFTFTTAATGTGTYRMDVDPDGSSNDVWMALRAGNDNRSGATLETNDDRGGSPFSSAATITRNLTANMTYTVEAGRRGFPGNGGPNLGNVRVTITPPPGIMVPLMLTAPPAQNYTQNTAVTAILPAASGGDASYRYSLTPNLPAGLTFDANTRTISGTPTTATATAAYNYTVTDNAGATVTAAFNISVADDPCTDDLGVISAGRTVTATVPNACMASPEGPPSTAPNPRSLFYTFTTGAAGIYRMDVDAVGDTNDVWVALRAGDDTRSGATLATNDDRDRSTTTAATILHNLTANTVYTVEAGRRGFGSGGPDPGDVRVTITPGPCVDAEVCNLNETGETSGSSVGRVQTGETNEFRAAQAFTTGAATNGWRLTSLVARFRNRVGSPGNIIVEIRGVTGGVPGDLVGTLTGANPTGAGDFTFTAAGVGLALAANTEYFTVMSAANPGSNGDHVYSWEKVDSDGQSGAAGWLIADGICEKEGSDAWVCSGSGRDDSAMIRVDATPAPAPSTPPVTTPVTPAALELATPGRLNFFFDVDDTRRLPAATGGEMPYDYRLTPEDELPPGLTLIPGNPPIISGRPTQTFAPREYTYSVTDAAGSYARVTFDIAVLDYSPAQRFADVGKMVLPDLARALQGAQVGGIQHRVGSFGGGARFSIGGVAMHQTKPPNPLYQGGERRPLYQGGERRPLYQGGELQSVAELLRDHAADGHWKPLLRDSEFVLPMKMGVTAGGVLRRGAFWGRGEYAETDGKDGDLRWDGTISGFHLGADTRLGGGLGGLAVSSLQADMDFQDGRGDGQYDLEMQTATPYFAWGGGGANMLAAAGFGSGDVSVQGDGGRRDSPASQQSLSIGGSGEIWTGRRLSARLRGEASSGRLKVDGKSGGLAAQEVRGQRARLALALARSNRVAGATVQTSLDLGIRADRGDGVTGQGGELGLGWGYHGGRVSADVRARTLVGHSGETEEWGIGGGVRVQPGLDGQGLAVDVRPAYGEAEDGIGRMWEEELPGKLRAASPAGRDYALRVDARLGYGLPTRRGLLTPFAGVGHGGGRWLGLLWRPVSGVGLSLRHEPGVVMLKGDVMTMGR